jgi:hypothetical protein
LAQQGKIFDQALAHELCPVVVKVRGGGVEAGFDAGQQIVKIASGMALAVEAELARIAQHGDA